MLLQTLLREELAMDLTSDQAQALWQECRSVLLSTNRLGSIVLAESCDGHHARETLSCKLDVLDAVGCVLAGAPWPSGSSDDLQGFLDRVAAAVKSRGYALAA